MLVNDKTKRDATFTNILTCSCKDSISELRSYLTENNITHIPVDSYNCKDEHSLTVLAFATTRYESKLIDNFVTESDVKYIRQVLR